MEIGSSVSRPNATPNPNLGVRQSWEHCHMDFLLRIYVTKRLQGIYISLHSSRNLFSGLYPRIFVFKIVQSHPL